MPKPQLKTSIYLGPDVLALISAREVGQGTRSEVIRACVERYAEICQRHRPALNKFQRYFLADVLDEDWLSTGPLPSYVPARVKDYLAGAGPAGPGPNVADLVAKLDSMTYAELVAVLDQAERVVAARKFGASGVAPRS